MGRQPTRQKSYPPAISVPHLPSYQVTIIVHFKRSCGLQIRWRKVAHKERHDRQLEPVVVQISKPHGPLHSQHVEQRSVEHQQPDGAVLRQLHYL